MKITCNRNALFWAGVIISCCVGYLTEAVWGWLSFGIFLLIGSFIIAHDEEDGEEGEE